MIKKKNREIKYEVYSPQLHFSLDLINKSLV